MVPSFDIELLNTLGKLIGNLERYNLEGIAPEEFDPADLFDEEQAFFRIQGLADFWSHQQEVDFGQHMIDLVMSAHNQRQADLLLVMVGSLHKLAVFFSLGSEHATRTILEAVLPGIHLEVAGVGKITRLIASHFWVRGLLTGVPSQKSFGMEEHGQQNRAEPRGPSPRPHSLNASSAGCREPIGSISSKLIRVHATKLSKNVCAPSIF